MRLQRASMNSFDRVEYRLCAIPSRRHGSAMLSSLRSRSSTILILSSAEKCRRVHRRMSFTTVSTDALAGDLRKEGRLRRSELHAANVLVGEGDSPSTATWVKPAPSSPR